MMRDVSSQAINNQVHKHIPKRLYIFVQDKHFRRVFEINRSVYSSE